MTPSTANYVDPRDRDRLAKMIGYIECKVWKNRLLPHYSRAIIAELGSLCTFMASKKPAES